MADKKKVEKKVDEKTEVKSVKKNIEVIMVKFGMHGRCICLKTHHT